MSDSAKPTPSWWQTLPGMLTAGAALITAVAGLIGVLHQTGLLDRKSDTGDVKPEPGAAAAPKPPSVTGSGSPLQAQAGHLVYKVLGVAVEPYARDADGKVTKQAVRISLRITDVMGKTDYVDRTTLRLGVEGAELIAENSINVAVGERQTTEVEALYIVPGDAPAADLIVGRPGDPNARIPLQLRGR